MHGRGWGPPPYALKGLVNHKQTNSDVTGGYLELTPERLRDPAQAVEDRLLKLAKVRRGGKLRFSKLKNPRGLNERWLSRC
jgi:hypothetical protein